MLQPAQSSWLADIVQSWDEAATSKVRECAATSWSPVAEWLQGYCADEAAGRHLAILVLPDHLDDEDQIMARLGALSASSA